MSDAPACAHSTVVHRVNNHDDGTVSDYWECKDCAQAFWPEPSLPIIDQREATMSDAPERIAQELRNEASLQKPGSYTRRLMLDASDRIAELEARARWIPVEERLPAHKQRVLGFGPVTISGTEKAQITWCDHRTDIFQRDERYGLPPGFTHWMPLPEPPLLGE